MLCDGPGGAGARAGRGAADRRGHGAGGGASGCGPGCGWARRSRAARSWPWSRPTRSGPSAPGRRRCGGWRGSARRSSPSGPARRSSRRDGLRGPLGRDRGGAGARPPGAGRPRGSAPGRPASAPTRPPATGPRRIVARRCTTRGSSWLRCRSRCSAGASARGTTRRDDLPNELERLGIATLGELAALPPTRSPTASGGWACGRCGWPAARTSRCGRDRPHEELAVELELPEAASGQQLERALELLVDRLLAHRERRGGRCGAAALGAARRGRQLAARGGAAAGQRRPARLAAALLPRLAVLPGPGRVAAAAGARLGPRPATS